MNNPGWTKWRSPDSNDLGWSRKLRLDAEAQSPTVKAAETLTNFHPGDLIIGIVTCQRRAKLSSPSHQSDPAPVPKGYCPFPRTHWSLVKRAGEDDEHARREALMLLLSRYEPALRFYLSHVKRLAAGATDDALQSFLADKVLVQKFMRHANACRGRFRTFLISSLNHYLVSLYRKSKIRSAMPLDTSDQSVRITDEAPPAIVEAAWARTLVLNVLEQMKRECIQSERLVLWSVFEGRVLKPLFDRCDPKSYESLAKEFALKSPTQAANLLVTAKRMYARLLTEAISEYEPTPADITAEAAELRQALGRVRTFDVEEG